jgi:hypothetical protein
MNSASAKTTLPKHVYLLMVTNLLKQETSAKVGTVAKGKMGGWDSAYLLKILCPLRNDMQLPYVIAFTLTSS